jgi:DNA mismatch endonuclease (patch repair protein)
MDKLTRSGRSANMARIRGRDTKPELYLQHRLKKLRFRFETHAAELPGKPDLLFRSRRAVIFLHGCFWHRHSCGLAYEPKTRKKFWKDKFRRNVERDKVVTQALRSVGWRVLIVWECQLKAPSQLDRRLIRFLKFKPRFQLGNRAEAKRSRR